MHTTEDGQTRLFKEKEKEIMWKLTIEQKKPFVYEGQTRYSTEAIEVKSDELSELTMLIERITNCAGDCETSYKVEKVGE